MRNNDNDDIAGAADELSERQKSFSEVMLASCRAILRDAMHYSESLPIDAAAALLQALKTNLQTVEQISTSPSVLRKVHTMLGLAYTTSAMAFGRAGKKEVAERHYAEACAQFERAGAGTFRHKPSVLTMYIAALEGSGRFELAAGILAEIPPGGVPVRVLLDASNRLIADGHHQQAARLLFTAVCTDPVVPAAADAFTRILESADVGRTVFACCRALEDPSADAWTRLLHPVNRAMHGRQPEPWMLAVRGLIVHRLGGAAEAIRDLSRACDMLPDEAEIELERASALCEAEATESAIGLLNSLGTDDRHAAERICLVARAWNVASNPERALSVLDALPGEHHGGRQERRWQAAAERERAIALARTGMLDKALEILHRSRRADDSSYAHERLQARLLLEASRWEDAANAAGNALDGSPMRTAAADLHLLRAKAFVGAEMWAEADDDLARVLELIPGSAETSRLRLDVLRRLERWEDLVSFSTDLLTQSPNSVELLTAKATALRALDRQGEALRLLASAEAESEEHGLLRLRALLLCDAGDFEGALDLLLPRTEPLDELPHELLSVRGWAHQNSQSVDRWYQAERVYAAALLQKPDSLWYVKGRANALRHIPGRENAARGLYADIIHAAEARKKNKSADPLTNCLEGWCLYCLGRFKEAADHYAAGLSAKKIGVAASFDYALVLLATECGDLALDEYSRAIEEAKARKPLRCCGLVYVALIDMQDGVLLLPDRASDVWMRRARQLLRNALAEMTVAFLDEFPELAERMRQFVADDAVLSPPLPEEASNAIPETSLAPDLTSATVIGFQAAPRTLYCGLLLPVFDLGRATQEFGLASADGALLVVNVQDYAERVSEGTILRLPSSEPGSATTRGVYLHPEFSLITGVDFAEEVQERLQWQQLAGGFSGTVAVTSLEAGERVLNRVAAVLIRKATGILSEVPPGDTEPNYAVALRIANTAVQAAQDDNLAYQAVLVRGAAGGSLDTSELRTLRDDLPSAYLADADKLRDAVGKVSTFLRQRPIQGSSLPPPPGPGDDLAKYSENPVIQTILRQVIEIAGMTDPEEQERNAKKAAAEIQAVVPPTPEVKRIYAELNERVNTHDRFYLTSDESILVMGREPAFYAPSVLLMLNERVAINSFALLKAARRLKLETLPKRAVAL